MNSLYFLKRQNLFFTVRLAFQSNWFFHLSLRGTPAEFLNENKSHQNNLKPIWIDLVFYADFKYTIGFDQKPNYYRKIHLKTSEKCIFWHLRTLQRILGTRDQLEIQWIIYQLVALSLLYWMVYKRKQITWKKNSNGSN